MDFSNKQTSLNELPIGTSEISEVSNKAENRSELECSVCLQPYHDTERTPKTLQCQHVFCVCCLEQLLSPRGGYRYQDVIKCPLCRSNCSVPCQGVQGLPTNFTIVHWLKAARRQQKGSHERASDCDNSHTDRRTNINPLRKLRTFGGHGSCPVKFWQPWGVAVNPLNNDIIISDHGNHRIQVFAAEFAYKFTIGSEGTGEGKFRYPAGVAVSTSGQIVVASWHCMQVFDDAGGFVRRFGSKGEGDGQFNYPAGVVVSDEDEVFVCDRDNYRIQVFTLNGDFIRSFGSHGESPNQYSHPPYHIAISNNKILITCLESNNILIFSNDGSYQESFNPLQQINKNRLDTDSHLELSGVCSDGESRVIMSFESGDLLVLNHNGQCLNHNVQSLNHNGQCLNHNVQSLNHNGQCLNHNVQSLNHNGQCLNHNGECLNPDGQCFDLENGIGYHGDVLKGANGMAVTADNQLIICGWEDNVIHSFML